MDFIVAGTFEKSLARMTSQEQKAVKLAAFDLQMNPAKPGFSMERLDGVRDPDFWSARVNSDIRIIVHRKQAHFVLCYVAHHDDAYKWAERRKFEVHPATGSAQFVEIVERTVEVINRQVKNVEPPVLQNVSEEYLFSVGVPNAWIDAIMTATDSTILEVLKHLPDDVQWALLELACGNPAPRPAAPQAGAPDPFLQPRAHPYFRVVRNSRQLKESLDQSWSRGSLTPDKGGVARGIRLFKHLVEMANHGQSLGISYSAFIEYLHGVEKFAMVAGRNYLPSDSGLVVRIALSITAAAGGRHNIARLGNSIPAGMDTFIWSKRPPFDRSPLAWSNRNTPPYSREVWLSFFPNGSRRLLKPVELLKLETAIS